MPGRWNGLWSAASCLRWFGGTLFLYLFHGGDQASQADLDGTQIADLVDFQLGVQLSAVFQNPPHLVGGDGIDAAAEGHQLYQLHIRLGGDVLGSTVHSGVVCPLVQRL